jgi:hypothetical protein
MSLPLFKTVYRFKRKATTIKIKTSNKNLFIERKKKIIVQSEFIVLKN